MKNEQNIKEIINNYSREDIVKRFSYASTDSLEQLLEKMDVRKSSIDFELVELADLKNLVDKLEYEDIKKIVNDPKEITFEIFAYFFTYLNEIDIAKYTLDNPLKAMSLFKNNISLVKPFFDNCLIFDLLTYTNIEILLNLCNDTEFLIDLLKNKDAVLRFSNSLIEKLAVTYFSNYAKYGDREIDNNLQFYLSGKKLAELYEKYNPVRQKFDKYRKTDTISGVANMETSDYAISVRKLATEKLEDKEFLLTEFIRNWKSINYNKLIFFLKYLDITDEVKLSILNNFFQNIVEESGLNTFQEIFDKEYGVYKNYFAKRYISDYSEMLLKDYEECSFDFEFFKDLFLNFLFDSSKDYNNRLFYSQLISFVERQYGIKVEKNIHKGNGLVSIKNLKENGIDTDSFISYTLGSYNSRNNTLSVNIERGVDYIKNKILNTGMGYEEQKIFLMMENLSNIDTVFHEMRHAKQKKIIKSELSMNALIFTLEELICGKSHQYYHDYYDKLHSEADARSYGYYGTCNFIDMLFEDEELKDYIKHAYIKLFGKKFLKDRKMEKKNTLEFQNSLQNLINLFKFSFNEEKRIEFREKYPVLKLILNSKGEVYSQEEMELLRKESNIPAEKNLYNSFIKNYYEEINDEETLKKIDDEFHFHFDHFSNLEKLANTTKKI